METTYSSQQQVYSLCALASASFTNSFDNLSDLQNFTSTLVGDVLKDSTVQNLIGSDWDLVWGPVVFSEKPNNSPTVSDNTMMLLYSPSQSLLVLSIAGTNPDSAYDWLQEDLQVGSFVKWNKVMGSGFHIDILFEEAAISEGTYTGLQVLLNMKNSGGQTMVEALSKFAATLTTPATLAVTGHSLGGALSPTMALYLFDSQKVGTNWNSGQKINEISVYATAGPTPGNRSFADYITHTAGLTGTVTYGYSSKYNSLDVIPQAWESDTLDTVPGIYEANINVISGSNPSEAIVGTLATIGFLKTLSKSTLYMNAYKQASVWTKMEGTFNTDVDDKVTEKLKLFEIEFVLPKSLKDYAAYFINFVRFVAQLAYQHTEAYDILLNITDFVTAYDAVKAGLSKVDQTPEQLREAAVSRIVGLDLSKFPLAPAALPETETPVG